MGSRLSLRELESGGASTSQPSAAPLRQLPTVTIVIDPTTGMIARPDCPMKTRMTYPSGNETAPILCLAPSRADRAGRERVESQIGC